jgi:hypothetical protein
MRRKGFEGYSGPTTLGTRNVELPARIERGEERVSVAVGLYRAAGPSECGPWQRTSLKRRMRGSNNCEAGTRTTPEDADRKRLVRGAPAAD